MQDDGDVYMGEYKSPFAIKLMKCVKFLHIYDKRVSQAMGLTNA